MSDPRHARARELFLATSELPPAERAAYLDRHCSDDLPMRREIESLLQYHEPPPTRTRRPAPVRSDAAAGRTIGRFEIERLLGEGGMGEVYLACDPQLSRQVALKALPAERAAEPQARRRLEIEARALAALDHPNVASVYEMTEHEGCLYLVLEHVPGETLACRLDRGPLSRDETLEIAIQIASGLEAAHAAGVVHRDLKPSNVMITPDGRAKVLDFGLARSRGAAGSSADIASTLTAPGTILGTPAYMSPEQARGQPTDATTDLWSFGCLLFECLAGERPFGGETLSDALARILEGEPPWDRLPADLPPDLLRLLRRCLTKDRRQRLQHPGDARLDLEEIRTEAPVSSNADGPPAVGRDRRLMRWLAVAGVALAGVGAGFATARLGRPAIEESTARTLSGAQERRLSISTPAEQPIAVEQFAPALALSPDGEHLVWVAAPRDGETRLVHRRLDRFELEPLPGTEGASGPFFSPDGAWVGFFADGELRKVPLAGGAPAVVTEARNTYGGVWTEDGVIHFLDAEGSELISVREDGRDPVVRGLGRRLVWPQLLPDGRGLLVSTPVSVLDPETGEVTVIAQGSFARYLDTGHLLYRNERNLLLVPFDLDTLRPEGSPTAVLDDARITAFGLHLAVARGGLMAYIAGPQTLDRAFVWTGGDQQIEALAERRPFGAFALDPKGDRLVVEVSPDRPDIWVFDLESGVGSRLTRGGQHRWPVWSADGQEVFACWFDGRRGRGVAIPRDGSEAPRRLFGETPGCPIAVSPDGRWLLTSVAKVDSGWDIHLARLDSEEPPEPWIATAAFEWGGAFSPDGRWFAYMSDTTGRYEVLITRFPEGEPSWPVTTSGGNEPLWTDGGRSLVYHHEGQWFEVAFEVEGATPRIGPPTVLIDGEFFDPQGYSFAISPKDRRLLLLRNEGGDRPAEIRIASGWLEPSATTR